VISSFRRDEGEHCALLGYCAASSGNSLPTFRDNLPVPSSSAKNPRKKNPSWILDPWKWGPRGCPETSV